MAVAAEPRILDVRNSPEERIAGLKNDKLRRIAEAVRSSSDERPTAGHLNYFKTTS